MCCFCVGYLGNFSFVVSAALRKFYLSFELTLSIVYFLWHEYTNLGNPYVMRTPVINKGLFYTSYTLQLTKTGKQQHLWQLKLFPLLYNKYNKNVLTTHLP